MSSHFIQRIVISCVLCSGVQASNFEILPVHSTGPHEIDGNSIYIYPGAQRIFFEIAIADWGPEPLDVYQVGLDSALITSDPSLPALAIVRCTSNSECMLAFGASSACVPLCLGGDSPHITCPDQTGCSPGQCIDQCESVFVDTSRPDFVFAGQSALAATSFVGPVLFGAVLLTLDDASDPGIPRYIGTVVMEVPPVWGGEQIVGFADDPTGKLTFLGSVGSIVTPQTLLPARIVMRCDHDADCDDGNSCTLDACNHEIHQCAFTPDFDADLFCCDPETGTLESVDDENDCTLDRCTNGETTHAPTPLGAECGDPNADICDEPDTCDGAGSCQPNHVSPGAPCGPPPTSNCRLTSVCDGLGGCIERLAPPLTPCAISEISTDCSAGFCDDRGLCVEIARPAGAPCGTNVNNTCNPRDACDGLGHCQINLALSGTRCGSQTNNACNRPDTCDGAGNCLSNIVLPGGTCGTPGVCEQARVCDEGGVCRAILSMTGTQCGNRTNTDCNRSDSCDGAGHCLPNHAAIGVPCGSQSSSECDSPDTCDGSGSCRSNNRPTGSPCGSAAAYPCNFPDTCDGQGVCRANLAPNGSGCDDGQFCNGHETCVSGLCTSGVLPCSPGPCDESSNQCIPAEAPYASIPENGATLSRASNNRIYLYPLGEALPSNPPFPGELEVRELHNNGLWGSDLSESFTFTLSKNESGTPIVLVVQERGSVLHNRRWYALRNAGSWEDAPPFEIDFLVQRGDANGDGNVSAADLFAVHQHIPTLNLFDPALEPLDITGDERILANDLSATNVHIPSLRVLKPSGH